MIRKFKEDCNSNAGKGFKPHTQGSKPHTHCSKSTPSHRSLVDRTSGGSTLFLITEDGSDLVSVYITQYDAKRLKDGLANGTDVFRQVVESLPIVLSLKKKHPHLYDSRLSVILRDLPGFLSDSCVGYRDYDGVSSLIKSFEGRVLGLNKWMGLQ